jgi:hypothetical protein
LAPGIEALIEIESGEVTKNDGVASGYLAKLVSFIEDHADELMFEWRNYHDKE